MKELLPVGSKVVLNNGRKLMIIGYLPSKPNDDILYDYICCRSLFGIRKKKEDLVLNKDFFYIRREEIKEVLFLGLADEESDLLIQCEDLVKEKLIAERFGKVELSQEELKNIYEKVYNKLTGKNGDADDEG